MCARSRGPVVRSIQTPEALKELRAWLETLEPENRERGQALFDAGDVLALRSPADHYVEADVRDEEKLVVTLFLTRGKWTSNCTCRRESSCRHAAASALAWLAQVEREARGPSADVRPVILTPAPAAPQPPPEKLSFRAQWEPLIAAKLGRRLTEAEGNQLENLAAMFAEFSHAHGNLYPGVILRHGFEHTPPRGSPLYAPAFPGWWDHDTQPGDPWALWQYLAYDYEQAGRPIPEVFRPQTDTAATRALVEAHLLRHDLASWQRALAAADDTEEKNNIHLGTRELTGLRARIRPEGGLLIEMRGGPGRPWKSPPQKWFNSLATTRPADFEHFPPADAALGLALAAEARDGAIAPALRQPLSLESTANLFRVRAVREAILMPDGRPLAIESHPLALEARISPSGKDRLDLRLVTPDGKDASGATLITLKPSPLYFFQDRVWDGPPPTPQTPLPTAALGDMRLMTRLRAAGLRLPAALERNVRLIPLRPRLKVWLDAAPEDADAMQFHAELLARADDMPAEQHFINTGWQWTNRGAPPPRRPGEPLIEFDLTQAQAAATHLTSFQLDWHPWDGHWVRPVTKTFPEDFVAWHASLPKSIAIEASPSLANLLGPPLRAELEFSAEPTEPGKNDWFDISVNLRVQDTKLTAEELALLLRAKGKWVSLPKHGWRRLEVTQDDETAAAALDRLGLDATDVLTDGRSAKHRIHALQLVGESELLEESLANTLRERARALTALPPPPLPVALRATLRPYQIEGYHFLAHLSALSLGGILADDMGLGKTVQTLTWLLYLAEASAKAADTAPVIDVTPGGKTDAVAATAASAAPAAAAAKRPFRALVVCPKSVTHGWIVETERFTPTLKASAFDPLRLGTDPTGANSQLLEHQPQLLITNYTQLRINAQWFRAQTWDAVVLDEGQFIKNPGSQVATVARALRTAHRVVLTGTPIENRLTDLWSLFAFAQPGLLGTATAFRLQYAQADAAALTRLHRRVRHFLLRRTKAQAAPELPPRTEDDLVVELEGKQRALYDAELKRARAQLLGVETNHALSAVRFNVLASLLRLRQICCHPALIDEAHRDLPSSKLEALLERLEELRDEGHQVLVFSQFVKMLEIIRDRLITAGIEHLILTGATENRAELVNTFQTDPTKTVFLLSLKAAGFGLNLTAASYVILYDPWWNPAAEAQAIDRTHRIGQTEPVVAYRLLASGTVEEKIRALQSEKAALANAVVQEESLSAILDLDSLRTILG